MGLVHLVVIFNESHLHSSLKRFVVLSLLIEEERELFFYLHLNSFCHHSVFPELNVFHNQRLQKSTKIKLRRFLTNQFF